MKIRKALLFLRYLPATLRFNLHYFPLSTALRLPVILIKPKLRRLKGSVSLGTDRPPFGMVKLGFYDVGIYPDSGIMWECEGDVFFDGKTSIGNDSKITVGKGAHLSFGKYFQASAALKMVCYNEIFIFDNVLVGWECTFSDTDFHTLKRADGTMTKGYGSIHIGSGNWIAMKSLILKGTITPPDCVIAANSMLNRDYSSSGTRIMLAGQPAAVVSRGIWHDRFDDIIEYNRD